MSFHFSIALLLFSTFASATPADLEGSALEPDADQESAENRHYASCSLDRKWENGKIFYGVSVYRDAPNFQSSPKDPATVRQFEQTRWYGSDATRASVALNSCKGWSAKFWCIQGAGRVLIGRSSVRSTSYPWVLVGPSGAIEPFHDGAFAWNMLAIEKCMEELVSTIHEKF
jgi:hypothetical protein